MKIPVLILCIYVISHCIISLNKMDNNTSNAVYLYHLIFAMAAFCLMIATLEGHHPTMVELSFLIGLAVRYMSNRRNVRYELRKQ